MRRRAILLFTVIGAALLLATGVALAASQLDQHNQLVDPCNIVGSPQAGSGCAYARIDGFDDGSSKVGITAAQTFTAGMTGGLDKVRVYLRLEGPPVPGDEVRASIQPLDDSTGFGSGFPAGINSAGGAVGQISGAMLPSFGSPPNWVEISFSQPALVEAGKKYALVMDTTSAAGSQEPGSPPGLIYAWFANTPGPYGGGSAQGYGPTPTGTRWIDFPEFDHLFQTFVDPEFQPPDNQPPQAEDQQVQTDEDKPLAVTLEATDADNDKLTYSVVKEPDHGTLSGTEPNLTYTPDPNYHGPDTVTFKANDGTVDSNIATVTIDINPVNDAPVAEDQQDQQAVQTDEDTPKEVTLGATDVDGDELTYSVVAGPDHGELSGSGQNLTYTPDSNYYGTDSFTFKANDGTDNSNIATVEFDINPVNDAPVADGDSYSVNYVQASATPLQLQVRAPGVLDGDTDVDRDQLTAELVTSTSKGDLVLNQDGSFTYTPKAAYFDGAESFTDTFTYKAKDPSGAASNTVSVTISVGRGCTISGTTGNDSGKTALLGSDGAEVICGLAGDDNVRAASGDDLIFGDLGKDTLRGEDGNDVIVAKDRAEDTIDCGKGNDTVLSYDEGLDKLANSCEPENRKPQG